MYLISDYHFPGNQAILYTQVALDIKNKGGNKKIMVWKKKLQLSIDSRALKDHFYIKKVITLHVFLTQNTNNLHIAY